MAHKKEEKKIMIPHVSVNPNYICIYNEPEGGRNYNTDAFNRNKVNLKDNETKGKISLKASKRINIALSWFAALSAEKKRTSNNGLQIKNRLSFITLTLSDKQKHTDQFIKQRMLNWFINEMKYKFSLSSYLWRAEAQENGNIHFHIVTNRYIHHSHVRHVWNHIQKNFGYTDAYEKKHGADKQPPSTEIKAVYNCKNISGYLSKYVTKDSNVYKFDTKEAKITIKDALHGIEGIQAIQMFQNKGFCKIKFESNVANFDLIENALKAYRIDVSKSERIVLRPIKGRLWYLSQSLSKIKNATEQISSDNFTKIQETIKKGIIKAKTIITDYCTTWVFPVYQYLKETIFEDVNNLFTQVENQFFCDESWSYAKEYWRRYKLQKA